MGASSVVARAIATNSSWNLVGSSSAGVGFGPEEPLLPRRRTDWWSAVLAEFFRIKLAETCYESVDLLPADLDTWLHHYNSEQPHLGYRNQGRRPMETIKLFGG